MMKKTIKDLKNVMNQLKDFVKQPLDIPEESIYQEEEPEENIMRVPDIRNKYKDYQKVSDKYYVINPERYDADLDMYDHVEVPEAQRIILEVDPTGDYAIATEFFVDRNKGHEYYVLDGFSGEKLAQDRDKNNVIMKAQKNLKAVHNYVSPRYGRISQPLNLNSRKRTLESTKTILGLAKSLTKIGRKIISKNRQQVFIPYKDSIGFGWISHVPNGNGQMYKGFCYGGTNNDYTKQEELKNLIDNIINAAEDRI